MVAFASSIFALAITLAGEAAAATPAEKLAIAPELYRPLPGEQAPPTPAGDAEIDRAIAAFQQRDYPDALKALVSAKQRNDEVPPGRLALARLFIATKQSGPGRTMLEHAAADAPDYPGVYVLLGSISLREGRVTDAMLALERASALIESGQWGDRAERYFLMESHAGLAAVAEARQDWTSAEHHLSELLKYDPDNGTARQRLARALFALERHTAAYDELQIADKDDPSVDPAAITMGWLYERTGDLDKANEWMEYAVRTNPDDARVHLGYATWLLRRDRPEDAKSHAQAAKRLDAENREVKLLLGVIARYLKNYDEAEKIFQEVHQDEPGDFRVSNLLALVLAEQDDPQKRNRALQLAEVNARQYPRSAEALATLGWVHYRLNQAEQAEKYLQAAMTGRSVSSETAYYMAHLLADRGQLEDAKQLLDSAVESSGVFIYRRDAKEWLDRIGENPGSGN
ncbi:MAG: tetratricopeptide repeat protein [Pirellulales bacterium]